MLHIFYAVLILVLLLGSSLSQSIRNERSLPSKILFLQSLALMLYSILGTSIYERFFPTHTTLYFFWFLYLSVAVFILCVLPSLIKNTVLAERLSIFSYLPEELQDYLFPQEGTSKETSYSSPSELLLSNAASSFDKLIVREIMIPKVDVFALPEHLSISEAFPIILEERYSRIPLYKKNIDNITGIVFVKDLLTTHLAPNMLSQPLSSISKSPFYAPEVKKVSSLLQEFRQKHRHLAIIVNEYGFTEGIVTMEDIIEEIFGEISDEDDEQEDILYKKVGLSWIVDGRMNISDAEETFQIKIPHGNYDTLNGHVFHKVGTVPQKGMKIHHENFDIEILTCSERKIGKLKITPREQNLSS